MPEILVWDEENNMKLEYKPIAIQDECFGGSEKEPEITVLVRIAAKGKKNVLTKVKALSFPDANYLDKYITENKIPVLPEAEFRATKQETGITSGKSL